MQKHAEAQSVYGPATKEDQEKIQKLWSKHIIEKGFPKYLSTTDPRKIKAWETIAAESGRPGSLTYYKFIFQSLNAFGPTDAKIIHDLLTISKRPVAKENAKAAPNNATRVVNLKDVVIIH